MVKILLVVEILPVMEISRGGNLSRGGLPGIKTSWPVYWPVLCYVISGSSRHPINPELVIRTSAVPIGAFSLITAASGIRRAVWDYGLIVSNPCARTAFQFEAMPSYHSTEIAYCHVIGPSTVRELLGDFTPTKLNQRRE